MACAFICRQSLPRSDDNRLEVSLRVLCSQPTSRAAMDASLAELECACGTDCFADRASKVAIASILANSDCLVILCAHYGGLNREIN